MNDVIFEFLPLVLFFGAYYLSGKNMFVATAACIAASWLQLLYCKIRHGKIGAKIWLNVATLTILGGLTITLHNKLFVMLKPTALYWLLALSLFVAAKKGKNLIQLLLQQNITLPVSSYNKLNSLWIVFFIMIGGINLLVAHYCTEETWVQFKLFGSMGCLLVFTIISAVYIVRQNHE